MIRILASDGIDCTAKDKLKGFGFDVVEEHYDGKELGEFLKDFDVLIVRSKTKVTRDVLKAAASYKRLKLVIRAGVGIDNIDVKAAKEFDIDVKNTPNSSSASVAELAIGHMFALSRFINDSNVTMREGKWNKNIYVGIELYGKTLGLIGFGRIAREVGKRAVALGMKVIYNDVLGKIDGYDNCEYCEFEELLGRADFISLHIPYSKDKGSVIGEKEIALMKDGVYLINCARGGVVEEKALLSALNSGKIRGAGIDVFEVEPAVNFELINHPRVSATPHIGASTREAQERIGSEIVQVILNYFGEGELNYAAKAI